MRIPTEIGIHASEQQGALRLTSSAAWHGEAFEGGAHPRGLPLPVFVGWATWTLAAHQKLACNGIEALPLRLGVSMRPTQIRLNAPHKPGHHGEPTKDQDLTLV